jgi:hypothetical protein
MSKNSTLKFVLSGLRSRFANSSGSLRDMFREWDTDKSGDVDSGELTVALHGLGFTAVKEADSEILIANIDIGGDGKIQYDDFVRLVCPPKQETRAVTANEEAVKRINAPVPPTELNLPGRVYFMGGRAMKRVLGPGEAANLRHSSVGDAGNGVASDALRESVMASVDAEETTIRRAFYSDLMTSGRSPEQHTAVSEVELGTPAIASVGNTSSTAAAATASLGSPRKRTTARREEAVELASLPPAVQAGVLVQKGIFRPLEHYAVATFDPAETAVRAPWDPPQASSGPSMDERIAAAHASNAAGRDFAEKVAAGLATMEDEGGSLQGAVHVNSYFGQRAAEGAPPLPSHVTIPVSPLALTSRVHAKRAATGATLVIPGTERGALASSATTNLSHPLCYLTSMGSSAVAPPASLLGTLVGGGGGGGGVGDATSSVPPPNSLDRSLHNSSRLPPRAEGLTGPFSGTGSSYSHETVTPDGGPQAVVVGHLAASKGCESITAVGASLISQTSGPFFSSISQRELDKRIGKLRLCAADVLDLPTVGRPTATHIGAPNTAVPPFSPLAPGARSSLTRANFASSSSPSSSFAAREAFSTYSQHSGTEFGGGGDSSSSSSSPFASPRAQRYAERRRNFFTSAGVEDTHASSPSSSPSTTGSATLGDRLSKSRSLRESRMASVLGGGAAAAAAVAATAPQQQHGEEGAARAPGSAGAGAAEGGSASAPVPPLALGSLSSISTAHNAGSSKVLANAVRSEGQRTTYLLAPPPTMRAECTPEHPSWNFASSARLAQTQTQIPEQALRMYGQRDKFMNLRETQRAFNIEAQRVRDHDYDFEQADIASRIARKREERGVYKALILQRKQGLEAMLCAPWPVGDVQL